MKPIFYYVKGGITIAAVLDKRRRLANGEWPVRVRVTQMRIRKYYSTGISCTEDIWERLSTTKSRTLLGLREEIELSFEIIRSHVRKLYQEERFSFDNLKMNLLCISGETLNNLLSQKIEELRKKGQIGTMDSYRNTRSNIEKFGGKGIRIENINKKWLDRFEGFLLESRSLTTVSINMRNIRTIMNIARSNNLIKESQYPFGKGKYEIKTVEGRKRALNLEQLKKIAEFSGGYESLMMFRDIWMFIYYCNGINIADLINLKFSNIIDDEICFFRQKTARTLRNVKEIRVTLTKEMKIIIDRWGNPFHSGSYIFPLIKHTDDPEEMLKRKKAFTRRFNNNMKIVGAAVGIFDISSYVARHSYATVLKIQGVSIAYISESLGHTSLNTTQSYLDSFEKEDRQKAAGLLNNF